MLETSDYILYLSIIAWQFFFFFVYVAYKSCCTRLKWHILIPNLYSEIRFLKEHQVFEIIEKNICLR